MNLSFSKISLQAQKALSLIDSNGFEGYIVGGCVRDLLMQKTPNDYDITTNATPDEIKNIFSDYKTIDTGLKHGTITVLMDNEPFEITTFREDTTYSDHRHPDKIVFAKTLEDDLERRDFTMNALALDLSGRIFDFNNGVKDIKNKTIRCVGDPNKRFSEDGLRVLRALRFASVLNFKIESQTAQAIHNNKQLLKHISPERIRDELTKLLCGQGCKDILNNFYDVIAVPIPELLPLVGFNQHTKYHRFDVWQHTIAVIKNIEPSPILRWTALLHDFGKPACFFLDKNSVGHFYGHPEKSKLIASDILERLKFDNESKNQILLLIENHMLRLENNQKSIKRLLNKLGSDNLFYVLKHLKADSLGKGYDVSQKIKQYNEVQTTIEKVLKESQCFSLKDLKINGYDLIKLGYKGKEIGETLNALLDVVITEKVENDLNSLLCYLKKY